MIPTRKRKSCEACRARKLRCSGEKSGCSRCRGLSMACRFKDEGAPGRPRKRPREECELPRDRTGSDSSSSHISPGLPDATFSPQETVNMLMGTGDFDSIPCGMSGNCGFDSSHWEMLGNGDICSAPLETWQISQQSSLPETEVPQIALDAYASPLSFAQSCNCDEEVSSIVRNLSRATMSHDVIPTLRTGVALTERILACPICYDVSKPPRVTVQNVLLIGHLMFEITSSYQKYLRWLKKHCTELDGRNESQSVYLDSGIGIPSDLNLQISGDKFRDLIIHGLQADAERLSAVGKSFALRQRNRHIVGHERCPDHEGDCRRKEIGADHDPLDLCPQNAVARKLIPCFRIVDEVRQMVDQVASAVV
ncbi:transcriptional regulator family: Fungal Specific TF [Penicillium brevicompactum]|uniref:transcriptional regulator family: Fungal Specific TF n=1 Tax=Penicillium brevicompactum TaxID=5074 RepID=UPI0025408460|nr:transcriptional regulator family: Fungal Specific TF [Penicillium brevicompactum]KAJ5343297.1 transcriptional regulator family: Fungal Specific TF [Penicillium brevicompactum]